MKYLSENHVGFDKTELAFPSLSGCQAVVYQTERGLYGLHNYGGAEKLKWRGRSELFAEFVKNSGGGGGTMLYGVCFASGANSRGYGSFGSAKTGWLAELSAFAEKLKYTGPISGYDLANQPLPPSVTVRFNSVGSTCVIQVKAYKKSDDTTGTITSATEHLQMKLGAGEDANSEKAKYVTAAVFGKVTLNTPEAGWRTVYPELLRG